MEILAQLPVLASRQSDSHQSMFDRQLDQFSRSRKQSTDVWSQLTPLMGVVSLWKIEGNPLEIPGYTPLSVIRLPLLG